MLNVLLVVILFLIIYASVRSVLKNKAKGKTSCGCGCSTCAMAGSCHGNDKKA